MNKYKNLPLQPKHIELGATLQVFAGFLMPMHYPQGIIKEHLHTRQHAGFFDLSHMGQFRLEGPDVVNQIQALTPSNISALKPGQQQYTVLTNTAGGVIDDIIVTRLDNSYLIIGNAACRAKDLAHLRAHIKSDCSVTELEDQALFAIQGPKSASILAKYCDRPLRLNFMTTCQTTISKIPCIISRCGYTGEDGFEISVANNDATPLAELFLAEAQVMAIGLGARNTLRLEAGLCLYGHELSETISPIEAGLRWIFNHNDSHFPGADHLLPQIAQKPDWTRIGLQVIGKRPVRDNAALFNQHNHQIGYITSASYSPTLGHCIAMARVSCQSLQDTETFYCDVRSKKIFLQQTALPFLVPKYFKNQGN